MMNRQETYSVVAVFTGSDLDTFRCQGLSNSGVTHVVIRCGGFLDEPRVERLELLHVLNRLRYIPDL
jgi:hypothetical protein